MKIENLIIMIVSYLIGSIPFAYILTRIFSGKDILSLGSGSVGAMNTYDITGKKWIGIAVFFLDAFKGFSAILIARIFMGDNFLSTGLAAICAILGHNYPVFLKFKGGRGLSTALGAMMYVNPLTIILWGLMWLVGYFIIMKNVHIGNVTAAILAPLLLLSVPDPVTRIFMLIPYGTKADLMPLIMFICLIILIRHIDPMIKLFSQKK